MPGFGWPNIAAAATLLGYLLTLMLIPTVLLTKKRWPASAVAWLMAILAVPIAGAVLFLIFGVERVRPRVLSRKAAADAFRRTLPQLTRLTLLSDPGLQETQRQMMRVAHSVAGTIAVPGNRVHLYSQTPDAFAAIESALREAQRSIHLEYYIWQPDRIGTKLRDLLIEKARSGVSVRFLYDSLGSMRLTRKFLAPMREAGVQIASFVPGQTFRERWSINLRSHRKIVLVDGRIGFTGGMNVGDEYLGRSKHFGYWRDTHLKLEGSAVLQLQDVFVTDWYYATGEELSHSDYFPVQNDPGTVQAQVLAGGPDVEPNVFHNVLFGAITAARQSVTLATSYFVPTPGLADALEAAALRGVRTRVLVSGPVTYWVTYHACRSFYEDLMRAGVEVYEYRRGQQHAKTLTIDGCWSLVGTPNFDARSVFLNFEVAVAFYDSGIAEQLEHHFEQDVPDAVRIDPGVWSQRSLAVRIIENACRMFLPVL